MQSQTLQRAETAADTGRLWTVDPIHSTIGFAVKHMKVATVHGRYGGFRGTIWFDPDRPQDASVEVTIDAGTIDTGEKMRDEHLHSADFFDVAAYPTIAFRSTRVEPASPLRHDRWRVIGNLTMRGVTRVVELAVELTDGPNPWDSEVTSFTATTAISRTDFGIGLKLPLNGGGLVISDEVKITLTIQATKTPL